MNGTMVGRMLPRLSQEIEEIRHHDPDAWIGEPFPDKGRGQPHGD